ncbi:MAG: 6-phospho-3-hexuloisomerase [Rhodobacter sp.]|nr:6-phospho-3-hexuloisomerase [Rhodobacter sp.]
MQDVITRANLAAAEIAKAAAAVDPAAFERLVKSIVAARRIALTGAGREGLMMRGLAMRLFHLGLDAHVVGEMTCPPLGEGDLLFASAGPGALATITALVQTAREAGADTICLTAQPGGHTSRAAGSVFHLPAQTMATDRGPTASTLPMGSVFEGAMFILFELIILALSDRLGISAEAMRARHTNLE